MFQNIGEMIVLLWRTIRALPQIFHQRHKVFDQLFEIGNASLLMACVLSLFIGGVIALQTGPVLAERGLSSAIGGLVGLSVYQEIDALRTMNINPVHYLVLPRIVAISISLPVLVLFAILVGWFGGGMVAVLNQKIAITFQSFFEIGRG